MMLHREDERMNELHTMMVGMGARRAATMLALASLVTLAACADEPPGANRDRNNGATNNGTNNGATNNGATNNGTNNGATNNGVTNNGNNGGCVDADDDGVPTQSADCNATVFDCDDTNALRAPGAEELCDGLDNNCDDAVDEGLSAPTCRLSLGVCSGAHRTCEGELGWGECGAATYGADYVQTEDGETNPEHCDGLDNDCDGQTDEGCPCNEGDSTLCGSDVGECSRGLQRCVEGQWGPCEGSVEPTDEVCDGRDNNCDSGIDEELQAPDCENQNGVCAGAKKQCDGTGGWSTCGAAEFGASWLAEETPAAGGCDGVDNDCDGLVDEDCTCTDGEEQSCGSDVGRCELGVQTCVNGRFGECRGQVVPTDESCDGVDNDCDGMTDEDLSAPDCSLSRGVCSGARKACGGVDGWLACAGVASYGDAYRADEDPTADCDGFDNDCDGTADEGCECMPDATQVCGTNVGLCQQGTQTCVAGAWSACADEVSPAAEICDGLDNDCDMAVDEDLGASAPNCLLTVGVCAGAKRRCDSQAGAFVACTNEDYGAAYQANETFCDGRDNDCDGETDEGCNCVDGALQNCGTDVGVCQGGTQTCVRGEWGPCEGELTGGLEVCDGLDNDCDGTSDDAGELTPPDCALAQGVCAGAKQRCGGDQGFLACTALEYGDFYQMNETRCDGRDNDCDGQTDEGCECLDGNTQVCGSGVGACQSGVQTCAGGRWGVCQNEVRPVVEQCDGEDNDCDTRSDEDLSQACPLQAGVCAGTLALCVNAAYETCGADQYGPNYELTEVSCDGRDNDCDGLVDEDCGPPALRLSEVLYDELGTDNGKSMFIEIHGAVNTPLGGVSLRMINGNGGEVYDTVVLPNARMPFNDYFLVVDNGAYGTLLDIADYIDNFDLQNGPDNVVLVWNAGTALETVLDALGYGVFGANDMFGGEGMASADPPAGQSLTRDASNTDTNDNATDFTPSAMSELGLPTPGGLPLPRIHVNLSWDLDASDLDLHLQRGGAAFRDAIGDCYFANRTPDWGVAGNVLDDARLDRDDTNGFGPELMDVVAPIDDSYLVQVDVWSLPLDANGAPIPTNVTVTVFVDGGGEADVNQFTFQHQLTSDTEFWQVARVAVVGGMITVTGIDAITTTAANN